MARVRQSTDGSISVAELPTEGSGGPVIVLRGDYDLEKVPTVERLLRRSFGPFFYRRHLIVDLSGVARVDATFIDLLVGLARRLHGERRELVLAGPQGEARMDLAGVGVPNLVPVYESVDEALAALGGRTLPLIPPRFEVRAAGRAT